MLRCNNLSEGYVNEDKAHGYLAYCALGSMTEYFCQLCFHVYLGSAVMGSATYGCLDYNLLGKRALCTAPTRRRSTVWHSPGRDHFLESGFRYQRKLLGGGLSVQLYGLKK